ncbi:MAG: undecaprenyldiphospho-muramoylpentapeptide beta-N-acetylglucosaminyltransferase [Chloroflexi bacterium]|nr:MAG: undecaprenyldiphospho-muramoylpentapeptide beta-N-acetylglucosaminyltransferase [Chloroflexota bacterium]
MRILISGGGTGGHIYPALAIAHALRDHYGAELLFLGDENGLEREIVPREGIRFVGVTAGKLRRYFSLQTISDLAHVPVGIRQAREVVKEYQPHAAFTSGGYASVPAGLAARGIGAPLVMHQQDVLPNLANRILAPRATRISVSFPQSLRYFQRYRKKTALTGNPVREEILRVANHQPEPFKASFNLDPTQPLLLVTGGSQGARHLNRVVASSLSRLLPYCQILHISGEHNYEETRQLAEPHFAERPELRGRYVLRGYISTRMAEALAASDILVCRAGAATLSELAILGRPSILIPLPPGITGSPQEINAAMFRQAGAAEIIPDRELTPNALQAAVLPILESGARRTLMANAARTLAQPQATYTLTESVVELAKKRIEKLSIREPRQSPPAERRQPDR